MADRPAINRVLVNKDGEALSESRSVAQYPNLRVAIIFIRNDGWTLAAPLNLADAAFDMWANEWVSFWEDGEIHPIGNLSDGSRKFRATEIPAPHREVAF